jgi:hypothetical protein
MTGARNLTGYPDGLAFKLPANFARDGINYVRITLDPSDTYVLRFAKLGLPPERKLKQVAEVEDVYSDNLREVFTRYTGLDTSLGTNASSAPSSAAPSEPRGEVAEAGPPAPAAPPPSSDRSPAASATAAAVAPSLEARLVEAFAVPRTYPAVRDALLAQDASLSREAVYAAFAALTDARSLVACGVGAHADTLYRAARGPGEVADVEQKIRAHVGGQDPNAVVITWQGGLVTDVDVAGVRIAESEWKRLRTRGLVDMIWVPAAWHREGAAEVFVKGRWISSPHAADRFRVASGAAPAREARTASSAAVPAPARERRPTAGRSRSRTPSPFAEVAAALAPARHGAKAGAQRGSTTASPPQTVPSPFAAVAAVLALSSPGSAADAPLPPPAVRGRLSRAQVASAGWTRVDPRPWGKLHARWRHPSGWRLEHCGHPTALSPWALYSPAGEMVGTGALYATPPNPRYGTAWHSLAEAIPFVADVLAGRRVVPGLSLAPAPRAPARRTRSPFAAAAVAVGGAP